MQFFRFTGSRKAFTLVELLVVILILSILLAVALPIYTSTIANASKRGCRANMHSIANAAQAWKVRNKYPDFTTLDIDTDLTGDLGAILVCPNGGVYTQVASGSSTTDFNGDPVVVAPGEFAVECSKPEHGGFVPGKTNF